MKGKGLKEGESQGVCAGGRTGLAGTRLRVGKGHQTEWKGWRIGMQGKQEWR